MLTEKELEERARYRRVAEGIDIYLDHASDKRAREAAKPVDTSKLSEDQLVQGARQLISDAQLAEDLKGWFPSAAESCERVAFAHGALAVLKEAAPEWPVAEAVTQTTRTRWNDCYTDCAKAVLIGDERNLRRERVDALEDMRKLYRIAAGVFD
jgi:hypothetical protein